MAITKVTNRVLENSSVGVAQLSAGAVPTKLTSEIGPLAFRNKIINGGFDIWQRGTSMSPGVSDQYLSDRWKYSRVGSTFTASRQIFTTGQTDVPGEPTYFHRAVIASVAGSSNYVLFLQHLEDVRTLAGKTVTLSFYAKADGNKPMAVEFTQSFGSGGSPSSTVTDIGVQKLNLTTSWQKFTVTANIPSMAGKTIGTNNNHCLNMAFWFDAGSSFNSRTNSLGQQSGTFDIAQVQLEEGPVATPFEQRPIGTELALCQRYYEKSYAIDVVPGTVGGGTAESGGGSTGGLINAYVKRYFYIGGTGEQDTIIWKTRKRVKPTVSYYNSVTGTINQVRDSSTGANISVREQYYVGDTSASINFINSGNGNAIVFSWTADAEL